MVQIGLSTSNFKLINQILLTNLKRSTRRQQQQQHRTPKFNPHRFPSNYIRIFPLVILTNELNIILPAKDENLGVLMIFFRGKKVEMQNRGPILFFGKTSSITTESCRVFCRVSQSHAAAVSNRSSLCLNSETVFVTLRNYSTAINCMTEY